MRGESAWKEVEKLPSNLELLFSVQSAWAHFNEDTY